LNVSAESKVQIGTTLASSLLQLGEQVDQQEQLLISMQSEWQLLRKQVGREPTVNICTCIGSENDRDEVHRCMDRIELYTKHVEYTSDTATSARMIVERTKKESESQITAAE
jgi:hypothetical protein